MKLAEIEKQSLDDASRLGLAAVERALSEPNWRRRSNAVTKPLITLLIVVGLLGFGHKFNNHQTRSSGFAWLTQHLIPSADRFDRPRKVD
jgi:hypothetical protein